MTATQPTRLPRPRAHAGAALRVRQIAATVALVAGLVGCGAERHAVEAGDVNSSGEETTSTQPDIERCDPNMPLIGDANATTGSLPPVVERTFVICVREFYDARGRLTVGFVRTTAGQAQQFVNPESVDLNRPLYVLFLKGPFNLLNPPVGRPGQSYGGPPPPTSVYGLIDTDGRPVMVYGVPDDYDLSTLGTPQSTVIDFGDTSETTTTPQ